MKNLIIFHALVISFCMAGQVHDKRIKKYYDNYDYPGVIASLQQQSEMSIDSRRWLAESYKITGIYKKAEINYAMVVVSEGKTAEDIYQYAQLLKMNDKYNEAQQQMDFYAQLKPNDSRVQLLNENKNYYTELLKDKGRFQIKNLQVNSAEQDFGVSYMNSQLVYTSSKHDVNAAYRRWNGNNLPFLDLYTADEDSASEFTNIKKLSALNKKYHEGPASYNKNTNAFIYTKDDYTSKNSDGVRKLELYESILENGKWVKHTALTLNSKSYSVGHPSISADGKTLYFASDMPGGKGGVDLYKATRMQDGSWSKPENLGDHINTEGNEVFPFIHESGLFFFSSDGRPGLGGLDVFTTQLYDGHFARVTNVGAPVNSSKDDFTFVLNESKTKGYFSSNREGGKGDDDIYSFNVLKPLKPEILFKGLVKDKNGNIIPGMMVYLYDALGNILDSARTNFKGYFTFANLDAERSYLAGINETFIELKVKDASTARDKFLRQKNLFKNLDGDQSFLDVIIDADPQLSLPAKNKAIKELLKNETENTVSERNNNSLSVNETNDPVPGSLPVKNLSTVIREQGSETGIYKKLEGEKNNLRDEKIEDLAFTELLNTNTMGLSLKDIYFDLDKFEINPGAALALNKVVAFMNRDPGLKIELSAHTDCRASNAYNKILSDKRAKATMTYIKARITNPARISGKGYGESKLINACGCEGLVKSACSEEEHKMNRRTEFKIINTEVVTAKN